MIFVWEHTDMGMLGLVRFSTQKQGGSSSDCVQLVGVRAWGYGCSSIKLPMACGRREREFIDKSQVVWGDRPLFCSGMGSE